MLIILIMIFVTTTLISTSILIYEHVTEIYKFRQNKIEYTDALTKIALESINDSKKFKKNLRDIQKLVTKLENTNMLLKQKLEEKEKLLDELEDEKNKEK